MSTYIFRGSRKGWNLYADTWNIHQNCIYFRIFWVIVEQTSYLGWGPMGSVIVLKKLEFGDFWGDDDSLELRSFPTRTLRFRTFWDVEEDEELVEVLLSETTEVLVSTDALACTADLREFRALINQNNISWNSKAVDKPVFIPLLHLKITARRILSLRF